MNNDALDICQYYQELEGWNDNTLVLLLTDFINAEKLGNAMRSYLETRRGDPALD